MTINNKGLTANSPIFLMGMPRSGTTWLSQIFESSPDCTVRLSPPYSNDFRGRLTANSSRWEWLRVLHEVKYSQDEFVTQNWRRKTGDLMHFEMPKSTATELAIKDTRFHELYLRGMDVLPKARLIYIVRHPAASLWSWKNCKEFPKGADFAYEWRRGECRKTTGFGEYWGFNDWVTLSVRYTKLAKLQPKKFLIMRYEDLVRQPTKSIAEMFTFCGLRETSQTAEFVIQSRSKFDPSPYSIFKGSKLREEWRSAFPIEILREIEKEVITQGLEAYIY